MKITTPDFLLARLSQIFRRPLRWAGEVETSLLAGRLASISITRPIFICGLARAGSTMLLELVSKIDGVATHRYCDFPFLTVPYLWNQYIARFQAAEQPVERPHKDRIHITRMSPEAMEEPLWAAWFPDLHSSAVATRRLPGDIPCEPFEKFHRDHLKKMLLIRGGIRYAAKNNYHTTRIEYLSRLYPDAEFIVPVRHPLSHVESLVQQHRLFCQYARQEPRVPQYLAAAGHFEFGPQRVPVCIEEAEGQRIVGCWKKGDDHGGYSIQWREIYNFIRKTQQSHSSLSQRIHIVRYEDFCDAPQQEFTALLSRIGLEAASASLSEAMQSIRRSPLKTSLRSDQQRAVWNRVGDVAAHFGYSP